jgi:sulfur carrier protein
MSLIITVHTDQGPQLLPTGSTVADLLHRLKQATEHENAAVATAVNGEFVPRSERDQHTLQDGDTLLCFAAITGG